MNRFLLSAAALVVAVPATAQVQAPLAPAPQRMEAPQTRDQAIAKVRDHFAKMDINRDGFVAGDEMQSMRGKHHGMKHKMGERRARAARMANANPAAAFDRIDANRDGMISRDEFGRVRELRKERKMNRMGAGRGMGGRMMRMADLDRDGRVSLQEATNGALLRFDRVDANRDGRITPDERRQNREQRRQMRAPKAG